MDRIVQSLLPDPDKEHPHAELAQAGAPPASEEEIVESFRLGTKSRAGLLPPVSQQAEWFNRGVAFAAGQKADGPAERSFWIGVSPALAEDYDLGWLTTQLK